MTIDIEILQFLHYHQLSNRTEIMEGLVQPPSDSTMKRLLSSAVKDGAVETVGRGPATRYRLTPQAHVTMPLDLATYAAAVSVLREPIIVRSTMSSRFVRRWKTLVLW